MESVNVLSQATYIYRPVFTLCNYTKAVCMTSATIYLYLTDFWDLTQNILKSPQNHNWSASSSNSKMCLDLTVICPSYNEHPQHFSFDWAWKFILGDGHTKSNIIEQLLLCEVVHLAFPFKVNVLFYKSVFISLWCSLRWPTSAIKHCRKLRYLMRAHETGCKEGER